MKIPLRNVESLETVLKKAYYHFIVRREFDDRVNEVYAEHEKLFKRILMGELLPGQEKFPLA